MSVGSKIRESRKQAMLSQLQLASGSGVSLATLQSIERDRANPSLSTIVALGHYLGLSLKLEPETINWPLLIAAGVPLSNLEKLDVGSFCTSVKPKVSGFDKISSSSVD